MRLSCVEAGATTLMCHIFDETSTTREYNLSHKPVLESIARWERRSAPRQKKLCVASKKRNLESHSLRPKVCFTQDQSTPAVAPKENVSSCCHEKTEKASLPQRWCQRTPCILLYAYLLDLNKACVRPDSRSCSRVAMRSSCSFDTVWRGDSASTRSWMIS